MDYPRWSLHTTICLIIGFDSFVTVKGGLEGKIIIETYHPLPIELMGKLEQAGLGFRSAIRDKHDLIQNTFRH